MSGVENLEVDKAKFLALKLLTFQKGKRVKRKVNNPVLLTHAARRLTPGVLGVQRQRGGTLAWVLQEVEARDEQWELLRTHIYL